jgi:DNA-binding transcriptional LysR family regulator
VAREQQQRYKQLRLSQLRAFGECARHKTFVAAARALEMTHPCVWQQIKALERQYGAALFRRQGRQLELTEEGLLFRELTGPILAGIDSLRDVFQDRLGEFPRTLRILGTTGVITEELAHPLREYTRRFPQVRISLLTMVGLERLLEELVSGSADMAVVPSVAVELSKQTNLILSERLAVRPPVLVVRREHALARKRNLTPADLVQQPLILPPPHLPWRMAVDEVFRKAGLLDRLQAVVETDQMHAARRYVSIGIAPAVLPLPAGGIDFPHTVVRPLAPLFPDEPIDLLWRRGSAPRRHAREFADLARRILQRPTGRTRRSR